MDKKTLVNFYGCPGAGKSTAAAALFVYLKNRACNVELVRELAKDLVYAKRQHEMTNQAWILGEQYKRVKDVDNYESVPLIITDSPILLGAVYSQQHHYVNELEGLMYKLNSEFENVNVKVRRVKPYNPSGRNQSESESDALEQIIDSIVPHFDYEINGDEEGQAYIGKEIFGRFGDRLAIKHG